VYVVVVVVTAEHNKRNKNQTMKKRKKLKNIYELPKIDCSVRTPQVNWRCVVCYASSRGNWTGKFSAWKNT